MATSSGFQSPCGCAMSATLLLESEDELSYRLTDSFSGVEVRRVDGVVSDASVRAVVFSGNEGDNGGTSTGLSTYKGVPRNKFRE